MKTNELPKFIKHDFQKSYLAKLAMIFPLHLHSSITNREENKVVLLPEKIGKYRFVKDLQDDKPYPFKIGLYKNNRGKKFVAKVWEGSIRNLHYFNLVNEIVAIYTLSRLRKKLIKSEGGKNIKFNTPDYVEVIKEKGRMVFISEFVEGKRFINLSEKQKVEVYKQSIEYLKTLGKYMDRQDFDLIRIKNGRSLLFQFPIILTAALLRRFYLLKMIFKGVWIFIQAIPLIKSWKDYEIVHGDVNYDNILIDKDEISIIDVEQLMYTIPMYEDVATISSARNTKEFSRWIIKRNIDKSSCDRDYALLFSALLINCEIHNLTGNSSEISLKNHIKRFKLGIKIYELFYKEKENARNSSYSYAFTGLDE